MSTWSLLYWVALVASAELCVQGHLLARVDWLHGGAWLLSTALGFGAFGLGRNGRGAVVAVLALAPLLLSVSTWLDPGAETDTRDARVAFWEERPRDRALLDAGSGDARERSSLAAPP